MALKTLLFVVLFLAACLGTFIGPIWPLLGYVAHYCIGPERHWWHNAVAHWEIRYAFVLGALTAAAIFFHAGNLRFGRVPFRAHELLLVLLLGIVWLSVLIGPRTEGFYEHADHPSVKFTKLALFGLMLTHVVTDRKNLDRLIWVLVVCAMVLGMQAWDTAYTSFVRGRLESVGGPDFREANFFAAFMATMLWVIGMQFLRSGWKGKILCFLSGGFTANAVILTGSRTAVVGLATGGMAAVVMAPRRYRAYIALGLVLAGAGFYWLSDDRFLDRSATIVVEPGERDDAAQSRIDFARTGLRMWGARPWGIGAGNYFQTVGSFNHRHVGMDPHNTYIRTLVELGAQGFVVQTLLILSAAWMLYRLRRLGHALPAGAGDDILLLSFGFLCALATMLMCGMFITLTYIEFWVWFLMLPVCLQRMVENEGMGVRSSEFGVRR